MKQLLLLFFALPAFGQGLPKAAVEENSSQTAVMGGSLIGQGQQLFNDPRLSANGKVSCATCHKEDRGFASVGVPKGLDDHPLSRRAPNLIDVSNRKSYFWDGRAESLERQLEEVLTNPREMGNKSVADAARRVGLSEKDLIQRITAFEKSIHHNKANRVARFLAGENKKLLTASEERGLHVFKKEAHCYKCHNPSKDFTDEEFHNTGIGILKAHKDVPLPIDDALVADITPDYYFKDWGRAYVTKTKKDMAKFRTPHLWGTSHLGPYMHDGSLKSLEDVIEFYDKGGNRTRMQDKDIFPLHLSAQQKKDLLAFLRAL